MLSVTLRGSVPYWRVAVSVPAANLYEWRTPRHKQYEGSVPCSESGLAYMTLGRQFSSAYVRPVDIIAVYLPVESIYIAKR